MTDPAPFIPTGQPVALQLIRKMVASGRVGGSYLFAGPPGVGKKTAARFFSMAVNCEKENETPCGRCEACRKILKGIHPDILTLTPQPGKQTIAVEQVRKLQETLAFGPYEGKRRVVIIDPADRLGLEASNALLLTLEAPPSHTLFILVTATPYALLETIRSRCQLIRLTPLPKKALLEIAQRKGIPVSPNDPVLDLCQGSVSRLLSLLEAEDRETSSEMDQLLTSFLLEGDSPGLIDTPKWAKQRDTLQAFLEHALWAIRDVWVRLETKGRAETASRTEAVEKIAAHLPAGARKGLPDLLEKILQALMDLKNNASPELIFTTLRLEMEELRG